MSAPYLLKLTPKDVLVYEFGEGTKDHTFVGARQPTPRNMEHVMRQVWADATDIYLGCPLSFRVVPFIELTTGNVTELREVLAILPSMPRKIYLVRRWLASMPAHAVHSPSANEVAAYGLENFVVAVTSTSEMNFSTLCANRKWESYAVTAQDRFILKHADPFNAGQITSIYGDEVFFRLLKLQPTAALRETHIELRGYHLSEEEVSAL